MPVVDDDHAVPQVGDMFGSLLRRRTMAVDRQQVEQGRMPLAKQTGITQSDAQGIALAVLQKALQIGLTWC